MQHEIRNAVSSWRGIRKEMIKAVASFINTNARLIDEANKQFVRMELILRGLKPLEEEKPWWKRLLRMN